MGPLEFGDLPEAALLLIDSPPIIYVLEDHPQFGPRFAPLFAAHAAGRLRIVNPFARHKRRQSRLRP